ncbi:MAG TPA: hypothetical protein VK252_00595 [Solirubrobacteraceae bacterium]|nr:hypothetical protein [Solirubrobacteraceae bacterium]
MRLTTCNRESPSAGPAGERLQEQPRDRTEGRQPIQGTAPGEPIEGREPVRARRRGLAWRTRDTGAAAVGAVGAGVLLVARLVMTAAALIALLIAVAIVLRDVNANSANTIVKGLHEGANFFAGSFTGLITFAGHPKRAITVDWGIALVAYLIVGAILSNVIAGVGRGGVGFERRHRAVPSN